MKKTSVPPELYHEFNRLVQVGDKMGIIQAEDLPELAEFLLGDTPPFIR